MSTQQRSFPTAADTERRARWRSFDVEATGPGMWRVESRDSGNEYDVFLDAGRYKCTCRSHEMHVVHGPLARCKHAEVIAGIVDGDLCPSCTYPTCRPSCPQRGEQ
jgi:hypothetical protein